jgi:GNAT superfamily N-acetyltransferase
MTRTVAGHPVVREAAIDDARALALVHMNSSREAYADLVPGDPPALDVLERDWATALTNAEARVFAAVLGDRVVGSVVVEPAEDSHDVGELKRLYVSPELWRRGIGALLHDAAVQALGRRFNIAELWVLERNSRARRFYERRRWQLVPGVVLEWPPLPVREVRYRLPLA